ncbi:uncharacterized protein LOC127748539 isoform X1 [Arachis duranensis]|uniref:Uncharacterized protein LOC127748539 isoform X1 n=1 Tax=Arachis duranensis TaxID=130453 RepID=A0A9C6TYE0_ARADU|nr:uncharacterized protein LOC127748539 isoform X1 [Arachis duranensis]
MAEKVMNATNATGRSRREIGDEKFEEKQNIVTMTVACCSPIESIEILDLSHWWEGSRLRLKLTLHSNAQFSQGEPTGSVVSFFKIIRSGHIHDEKIYMKEGGYLLRVADGRTWKVTCKTWKKRDGVPSMQYKFTNKGWIKFSREMKITKDDVCLFELLDNKNSNGSSSTTIPTFNVLISYDPICIP